MNITRRVFLASLKHIPNMPLQADPSWIILVKRGVEDKHQIFMDEVAKFPKEEYFYWGMVHMLESMTFSKAYREGRVSQDEKTLNRIVYNYKYGQIYFESAGTYERELTFDKKSKHTVDGQSDPLLSTAFTDIFYYATWWLEQGYEYEIMKGAMSYLKRARSNLANFRKKEPDIKPINDFYLTLDAVVKAYTGPFGKQKSKRLRQKLRPFLP